MAVFANLGNIPFTERMTYDSLGRQHLHISFEGVVSEHVYGDTTGRLIEKRFFDNLLQYDNGAGNPGEVWTYTHDAFGRVVNVERQSLSLTTNETTQYAPQGRVASVTTDEGTVSYSYDQFGRLASTTIGTHAEPQRIISYTYDQLGRLKTVSEDQDPSDSQSPTLDTRYGYMLQGSLRRTDLPNGTIEKYIYDELNRLDLLTVYGPDETPEDLSNNPKIARFDYTVRADGRRTALVEEFYEDGQSTPFVTNQINWQYDALGRLIEEDFDSSDDSLDYLESFLFDLASNRLEKTRDLGRNQTIDETTTYEYDANDRLWSEAVDRLAADNSLTEYDWLGTQQIDKTVYTGDTASASARVSSTEFGYDLQGRLQTAKITQYSGGNETHVATTTYDYNSSGIRVSALTETDANGNGTIDSRVLTEFLNDANNHTGYSQVLRESHYDADTDKLTRTVDYTFGHAEISQRTVETNDQGQVTNDQTLIFAHDGHGSVRVLTDLAAAAVQFYAFDAYGQMLAIWNDAAQMISGGAGQYADPAAALTNLLYAGEQFDTRINQQYLRARYYDPTTGRFNRLDPFFGNHVDPLSFHKYLYVHADPITFVDPSGLSTALTISLTSSMNFGFTKADLNRVLATGAQIVATISAVYLIAELAPMAYGAASEGIAVASAYLSLLIANVQVITRTAAREIARTWRRHRIPVFPVFQVLWPDIYLYRTTSAVPLPSVLTYMGPAIIPGVAILRARNRANVFARYGRIPAPSGMHLDEYPYASTVEGGRGAIGQYVPARQNLSEGAMLGWFYRRALLQIPGRRFLVVFVP